MALSKFLENVVILCLERRFTKQNSVIRRKSNIFAPPNVWAGYAIGLAVLLCCELFVSANQLDN